jgi:tRNA (guanine10-N2)-methyltransferase
MPWYDPTQLCFCPPQVLDAIVGDPPYGVRAGGRKSKCNPDARIINRATYIPSTAPYTLTECLSDLLEFAAVLLVVGECAEHLVAGGGFCSVPW